MIASQCAAVNTLLVFVYNLIWHLKSGPPHSIIWILKPRFLIFGVKVSSRLFEMHSHSVLKQPWRTQTNSCTGTAVGWTTLSPRLTGPPRSWCGSPLRSWALKPAPSRRSMEMSVWWSWRTLARRWENVCLLYFSLMTDCHFKHLELTHLHDLLMQTSASVRKSAISVQLLYNKVYFPSSCW